MVSKIVASLLIALCIAPTTAPFAVPSVLLEGGHSVGGSIVQDTAAPSVADDDAVPLERSTFLSESKDYACAPTSYVVVSNFATSFHQGAGDAASVVSLPTIALVLRV
jgi:hypothetical protein